MEITSFISKIYRKYAGQILTGIFLSVLVCFSVFKINDPDTMQYLANGKHILQTGFSQKCVFNYTSSTCQTVYAEWLFHVVSYLTYVVGSYTGLVALQLLLVVGTFFSIIYYNRKRNVSWFSISLILLLTVLVAMERFMLRADLAALLWFVLMYGLLGFAIDNFSRLSRRALSWLAAGILAVQLVWTNTHGSFPLGWIIIGAFLGESVLVFVWRKFFKKKKIEPVWVKLMQFLVAIFISSVVVSLLNPYGFAAFTWPFKFYFGNASFYQQLEFASPFAPADFTHLAAHAYTWLLVATALLGAVSWKKLRWADIALFVALGYLSILHVRYIALFAVFASLTLPVYMENVLMKIKTVSSRVRPTLLLAMQTCGLLVLVVVIVWSVRIDYSLATNQFYIHDQRSRRFGFGLSENFYPAGGVDFIKAHNVSGNMFNDYGSGTYINWLLYPDRKSFIDGHSYTLDLLNYYNDIVSGKIDYATAFAKYDITYVVLNYTNADTQNLSLTLYHDPQWALVFFDENSLVFLKRTQQNQQLIDANAINFENSKGFNPATLVTFKNRSNISTGFANRGEFFDRLGLFALAQPQLESAVSADPKNYVAYTNLGATYQQLGQLEKAKAAYEKAVALESAYAPPHYNLGLYFQSLKQWDSAVAEFQSALHVNPAYMFAHLQLGKAYRAENNISQARTEYQLELQKYPNEAEAQNALNNLGDAASSAPEQNIPSLEAKVKASPKDAAAHFQLGLAYGLAGEHDKAIVEFKAAIAIQSDFAEAHLNLGNAYSVTSQWQLALSEYQTVAKLKPDSADAYLNIGVIYRYHLADPVKALAAWQQFLQLSPHDPQAPEIQQEIINIVKEQQQAK